MGTPPHIFCPQCIAAVPYFDLSACAGPSMATVPSGNNAHVRVLVHYFRIFGPWRWWLGFRTFRFNRFVEALWFLQGHEDFPYEDANYAEYLLLLSHAMAYGPPAAALLPLAPIGPPPAPPAAPPPPAADFW